MKKIVIVLFLLSIFNAEGQAPNWIWAKSGNGKCWDAAWSVAVDLNGNSYAAGLYCSDTLTFAPYSLLMTGSSFDIFLTKYDPAGNVVWVRKSSETGEFGNNNLMGMPVTVDAAGNIYMAGYFRSPAIIFDGHTLLNTDQTGASDDIFLVKYDTNGNVIWAKSEGGTSGEYVYSLSVNTKGDLCMAGVFTSSSITFGSTTLTNASIAPNWDDLFYAVYDSSGTHLLAKAAGGTGNDWAVSTVIDEAGNVYITGFGTSPAISFDAITLTNNGDDDIFVAKYDMNGNILWARRAGGTGGDDATAIAVDNLGCVYVSGFFYSYSVTFGSITLWNPSTDKVFLTKYDASGNVLWAKQSTSPNGFDGDNRPHSIALDASANIYVAGYFYGPKIKFNTVMLTNFNPSMNSPSCDVFLTKYDSSGTVLWAKSAGYADEDVATGVAVDNSGNVYVAGFFTSGTIAFDAIQLTNVAPGDPDIFIAKLGNQITGTIQLNEDSYLPVYPNPAKDYFVIPTEMKKGLVEIYNSVGEKVYSEKLTSQLIYFNPPAGIYFVKVNDGEKMFTQKLVIE